MKCPLCDNDRCPDFQLLMLHYCYAHVDVVYVDGTWLVACPCGEVLAYDRPTSESDWKIAIGLLGHHVQPAIRAEIQAAKAGRDSVRLSNVLEEMGEAFFQHVLPEQFPALKRERNASTDNANA